jgi:hypothetical protein
MSLREISAFTVGRLVLLMAKALFVMQCLPPVALTAAAEALFYLSCKSNQNSKPDRVPP